MSGLCLQQEQQTPCLGPLATSCTSLQPLVRLCNCLELLPACRVPVRMVPASACQHVSKDWTTMHLADSMAGIASQAGPPVVPIPDFDCWHFSKRLDTSAHTYHADPLWCRTWVGECVTMP